MMTKGSSIVPVPEEKSIAHVLNDIPVQRMRDVPQYLRDSNIFIFFIILKYIKLNNYFLGAFNSSSPHFHASSHNSG